MLLITGFFFWRRKKALARQFLWISLGWLFLISTPFIPDILVKNLENKYPSLTNVQLQGLPGKVNILVLGGGVTNDLKLPPNDQLSEAALVRLSEGIRLFHLLPESHLITSGWGGREEITSAEVVAQTAKALGVDAERISMQPLAENTWQEALEYKRLFSDSCPFVLVTSALHMPRSMNLFQKAGLNPIAAPTNHLYKRGEKLNPWFWLPSSNNIKKMEAAIHEYVGLLWYSLGGEKIK